MSLNALIEQFANNNAMSALKEAHILDIERTSKISIIRGHKLMGTAIINEERTNTHRYTNKVFVECMGVNGKNKQCGKLFNIPRIDTTIKLARHTIGLKIITGKTSPWPQVAILMSEVIHRWF